MVGPLTQKFDIIVQRVSHAPLLRLTVMASVIIVLLIPLYLIQQQLWDRQSQRDSAVQEVTSKWGTQQTILGPLLVIPYYEHQTLRDKNGKVYDQRHKRYAGFLPEHLTINSKANNEVRHRGLFDIPLYQAEINLSGDFPPATFSTWSVGDNDIVWSEASVIVLVSDAHAIQQRAQLHWNNNAYSFAPGAVAGLEKHSGYHVALGNQAQQAAHFQIQFTLNGSQQLKFAPIGNDSSIRLQSDWPDPSFTGQWLPNTRELGPRGFNSEWRISALSRGFGQQWLLQDADRFERMQQSAVGVDFLVAVDNYRMAERSSKYDLLFILLTFLVIWLMEVTTQQRVHFIQYLLLGSALCIFYLLLTAFAEHIGFYPAYAIASVAVIATVGLYSKSIVHSWSRASIVGGIVAALYLYLFSLLNEQNYAYLIGSIGMFAALLTTMYLTRRINWYNNAKRQE
ncbi:MAG: cell envelope integrity protein CreD [Gammaproteobacteria bacterium]|nr:cell envelope integrity protein CreD [Gammaproteobacteria bacterium]